MGHDSIFTRLIRPTALSITLLIFFILMILDGNFGNFTIKTGYLSILETILTTMVIFYFSSRGLEKVATTFSNERLKEFKLGNIHNYDKQDDFDPTLKDV